MTVKRIVLDLPASSVPDVQAFYVDLLDLDVVMDQGWIVTLSSGKTAPVQISIASQGGSDAPVPDASLRSTMWALFIVAQSNGAITLHMN